MFALLLTLLSAQAATRASSELTGTEGKHPSALAFDGLLKTGWAEGAAGNGEGSWLELDLGRVTEVTTLSVWPGNLVAGSKSFREYSRPKTVQIYVDDKAVGGPVRFEDAPQRYDIPVGEKGAAVKARTIKVEVKDSYDGGVFPEMYIAEVAVDFPSLNAAPKMASWLKSKDYDKQEAAFEVQVADAYAKHKAAEFGDDKAFSLLTDAVADNAPFVRAKAAQLAPDGSRAQAVGSSDKAQEAIRKLKDPNGIPAFQLAQLRATGEDAAALEDVVEIFSAYQELIGGGNRNIPYWGQHGWETGALNGFGEPLALALDKAGNVYIADTGNNRIQKFAENGRPMESWGGDPDITDAWFAKGRKWYVSGAKPGTGNGQFTNPLAVADIPEKDGDKVAVLDATGRIQLFDQDGKLQTSWKVATDVAPAPNLGGTAYLIWVPQKSRLYAVIQEQVVGFTLDATETSRWEIKDGTPKAVVLGPGGKLLMAFGYEVVSFDPEGFRYGTEVGEDALGQGFEDIDLAIDQDDKLWAIEDNGMVIRFKKPGKAEFSVVAITRPIHHPRMVAHDGIIYVTSDDKVEVVDAYQAHLDAAAAEKDAQPAAEKPARGKGKGKGKGGGLDAP